MTSSLFPFPGAGLGSSAAYAVSLAGGMLFATSAIELNGGDGGSLAQSALDLVNKWAFVSEQIIHGTPSGIDNSIATCGGALSFIKGEAPNQIPSMPSQSDNSVTPFLPRITSARGDWWAAGLLRPPSLLRSPAADVRAPLVDPIAFEGLRVLLVNTRVSRSTKEYVAGVRRKLETFPAPMGQILDAMDSISKDVGSVKSIYLFYSPRRSCSRTLMARQPATFYFC